MNNSTTVLVLGAAQQSILIEMLFEMGVVPIVRKRMLPALDRIRHESFDAVFLDQNHGDVDVLEFVLNIRDHDSEIPIVVVGEITNDREHRLVYSMQPIFLVKGAYGDLEGQIQQILRLN